MTATEAGVGDAVPEPRAGIPALGHLAPDPQPRRGSLLRAELMRLRARRLILLFVIAGSLGFVANVVGQWVNHEKPSAAAFAAAQERRDSMVAQMQAECRQNIAADQANDVCGGFEYGVPIEAFLRHSPFDGRTDIPNGVLAVGAGLALLGFLTGASFIGAEWSSRNLAVLLTWQPRRLQVMGTKLLAVAFGVAAAAVVAEALWLGAGGLIMHGRGIATDTGGTFWQDTTIMAVRAVGLAVFATAIGFALAMLLRNTAAALGVAFGYFAVGEMLIRQLRPGWSPYLLLSQFDAWLSNGGSTIDTGSHFDRTTGTYESSFMHLSTPRAALTLAIYAAVLLGFAALVFRRRDVA